MQDMRTPDGWSVYADHGRGIGPDVAPALYVAGARPEWMRIILVTPDGERGVMDFQRRDESWQLATVTSLDAELTTLLARTTKTHSLTWWKRKAMFEITMAENKMVEDIVGYDDPARARAFAAVGQRAIDNLLQAPVRRQRKRVTEDRLQQIADMWMEAHRRGSRTPTKDVWEILNEGKSGNEMLSKDRVRHLISEARKLGKLDAATNGPPRASPDQ